MKNKLKNDKSRDAADDVDDDRRNANEEPLLRELVLVGTLPDVSSARIQSDSGRQRS